MISLLKQRMQLRIVRKEENILTKKRSEDERVEKLLRRKSKRFRLSAMEKHKIETLINEDALLLAGFIRNETPAWIPRLINL
jgi:hypothetical protein